MRGATSPTAGSARRASSGASQPGSGTTSESRKATNGVVAAASPALRAAAGPRGAGCRSTVARRGDRPDRGRVGGPVVDDDHPEPRPLPPPPPAAVGTGRDETERGFDRGAKPPIASISSAVKQAGQPVGAVLHRDHDRDVRRRRHGGGRLGHRVRDPGVEQAAGERGRGRVGDGEPPVEQPGGRGGRQVQHPRRRPAQQHRAVVEDAGPPLQARRSSPARRRSGRVQRSQRAQ